MGAQASAIKAEKIENKLWKERIKSAESAASVNDISMYLKYLKELIQTFQRIIELNKKARWTT